MMTAIDRSLAIPLRPDFACFNSKAEIPYRVTIDHLYQSMLDFSDFLETANVALASKGIDRLEDMLMPANFSSIVGEFMTSNLPKHCPSIAKNNYHNGHPDLLPAGKYTDNSAQHAGNDGIEVKASRYLKRWQGHNQEDSWLMVFVFESGRPSDTLKKVKKFPFRFLAVYGALLKESDWKFDGRGESSRRTITATVTPIGYAKMTKNWIYQVPELMGKV